MTGGGRLLLAILVGASLATAIAGAPASPAAVGEVAMQHAAFAPSRLSVLAGDSVSWRNTSARTHNLQSSSAGFDSGRLAPGTGFSHAYAAPGSYGYACTIHLTMTGVIDVYALLLEGPEGPVTAGSLVPLTGRAATGRGPVTIEEDRGAGFRPVATVSPDPAGSFRVSIRASATTSYRAWAAGMASPPIRVTVAAPPRPVAVAAVKLKRSVGRRRVRLSVRARSAAAGTFVALQYSLRERSGWRRIRRGRLGSGSRASFLVRRPSRSVRARVVLIGQDGQSVMAVSNVVKLRPAHRSRRRR